MVLIFQSLTPQIYNTPTQKISGFKLGDFSTSASSRQFHLLLGAEEPATLMQNVAISLIFMNKLLK